MKIAIFGTGGVGGYAGARLAAAGHEVHFIARGRHLDAIRRDGLRVESIKGDIHVRPARATDQPAEIEPVDWVLCAVKTWQLPEAAAAMPPLLGPGTPVLSVQNSVEAADRLAEALGAEHVLGGAAWIRAEIVEPGLIRHSAIEPRIVLGELGAGPSRRAEEVRSALAGAGVQAEVSTEIRSVIWSKFLFIASFSGVGAVARAAAGEFRNVPPTRAMLRDAMEEIALLARARGVRLDESVVQETLRFVDGLPASATSSMQRDIFAGRPSELDDQSGAVVRLARQVGVPTPVHDFLYAALLPQESRARAPLTAGAGP
ncbi:MAG: 2-dehydropantoate 2-reductase [Thermoanaerobaculia bacterium]